MDFAKSDSTAIKLIEQQPLNDMAKDILGKNYISQGKFEEALKIFESIRDQNYKYLPAYEQAALVSDSLGDYKKAAYFMERGYQLGLRNKEHIESLADYLEAAGYHTKAQKFRTILNKN